MLFLLGPLPSSNEHLIVVLHQFSCCWLPSGVSATGSKIPWCLSQAIKHKLHMKSVVTVSDHTSTSDVQQEEDKAKLLLGAKLQVCNREG